MSEILTKKSVLESMKQRFTSGNSVPVERTHVTAQEWAILTAEPKAVGSNVAILPDGWIFSPVGQFAFRSANGEVRYVLDEKDTEADWEDVLIVPMDATPPVFDEARCREMFEVEIRQAYALDPLDPLVNDYLRRDPKRPAFYHGDRIQIRWEGFLSAARIYSAPAAERE